MNHDDKTISSRRVRALVAGANVIFASAFIVSLLGHWRAARFGIGAGLIPAIAAEVLRRR